MREEGPGRGGRGVSVPGRHQRRGRAVGGAERAREAPLSPWDTDGYD